MIKKGEGRIWAMASIPLVFLFGITAVSITLLWLLQPASLKVDQVAAAQMAKNQEVFATCEVIKKCLGGFVKFKDGKILQLQVGANFSYAFGDHVNDIDFVVLPDHPAWRFLAVAYAEQFVEK